MTVKCCRRFHKMHTRHVYAAAETHVSVFCVKISHQLWKMLSLPLVVSFISVDQKFHTTLSVTFIFSLHIIWCISLFTLFTPSSASLLDLLFSFSSPSIFQVSHTTTFLPRFRSYFSILQRLTLMLRDQIYSLPYVSVSRAHYVSTCVAFSLRSPPPPPLRLLLLLANLCIDVHWCTASSSAASLSSPLFFRPHERHPHIQEYISWSVAVKYKRNTQNTRDYR